MVLLLLDIYILFHYNFISLIFSTLYSISVFLIYFVRHIHIYFSYATAGRNIGAEAAGPRFSHFTDIHGRLW